MAEVRARVASRVRLVDIFMMAVQVDISNCSAGGKGLALVLKDWK